MYVDLLSYAHYETAAGPSVVAIPEPPLKSPALNLDELSVAEIKAFVNAGELTAEEVYRYESNAAHPRKSLLNAYAPKDAEEASE